MITIEHKTFGKLDIPREGFDKQSLMEKYLDGMRQRDKEIRSEDGETIYTDKHNRVVCEEAMKVGWVAPFDITEESPKKIAWIARGVWQYITDCMTIDPS